MFKTTKHKVMMILIFLGVLLGNGRIGYQTASAVADGVDVINYSISGTTTNFPVLGDDDIITGYGSFWIDVDGDTNGRLKGDGELVLPTETVRLTFRQVEEIIYANGEPVGLKFSLAGTNGSSSQTTMYLTLSDGSVIAVVYNNGNSSSHFDVNGMMQFTRQ